MILDNQNLPEIVVSREAGRINNLGNFGANNSPPIGNIVPQGSSSAVQSNLLKMHESPKLNRQVNKLHDFAQQPNNNENKTSVDRSNPGWDDAPGSPHRVPLISNNNGSPRLSNRIANIYGIGRHQGNRQSNVAESPHGSPRHQAIARIVSPNPEIHRNVSKTLEKKDTRVASSPKFNKKINSIDTNTSSEIGSPKRMFFANNSPCHSPGYHNPYQQTTFVKSPLLQTNEVNFKYDSPTHKVIEPVDSPKHVCKPPHSPRHNTKHREECIDIDSQLGNDNTCYNSNDTIARSHKSRIPCKITQIINQCDSKTELNGTQNNLSVVKQSILPNPKKISQKGTMETNLKFEELFNVDSVLDYEKQNSNVRRPQDRLLLNKFTKNVNNTSETILNFPKPEDGSEHVNSYEIKSEIDVDQQSSMASNDWNSEEFSLINPNNTCSWNSNSECTDQKMSIDEKCSLKRSCVDSLRPRTNSLGSWPHSSSQEKSYNSGGSMGGSVGINENISDTDSRMAGSVSSKMVLIKCKDGNYLTRVFISTEGSFFLVHNIRKYTNYSIGNIS